MIIKVCGLTTVDNALAAVNAGADFIGCVLEETSRRFVAIDIAANIARAVKAQGAMPVAVVATTTRQHLQSICQTDMAVVQLHSATACRLHQYLPEHIARIFVIPVRQNGELIIHPGLEYLDQQRDYLLFDNERAGSGKTFNWDHFKNPYPFRYFIAGGLYADNVNTCIAQCQPDGVDVSSGVECQPGIKDPLLIQQFIQQTREQQC